jgi:hypothetical protein
VNIGEVQEPVQFFRRLQRQKLNIAETVGHCLHPSAGRTVAGDHEAHIGAGGYRPGRLDNGFDALLGVHIADVKGHQPIRRNAEFGAYGCAVLQRADHAGIDPIGQKPNAIFGNALFGEAAAHIVGYG